VAKVSLKSWFVRWLEKMCVFLDAAPAWYKDDEETTGFALHYCPLGDVWSHPVASWSLSLDKRWDTDAWQAKEAS